MKRPSRGMKVLKDLNKKKETVERKKKDFNKTRVQKAERETVKKERILFIEEKRPGSKRKHSVLIEEEEIATEPQLLLCFRIPDMANLINAFLGPQELFCFSKVCREMTIIVTNSFLKLVPHYLTRFGEGMHPADTRDMYSYDRKKTRLSSIATAYNEKTPLNRRVTIGALLSLFFQFFQVHRSYKCDASLTLVGPSARSINYSFMYNEETGSITPLRNPSFSVFTTKKYKDAISSCKFRLNRHYTNAPDMASIREPIQYFNLRELSTLALKPVNDLFAWDECVIVTNDTLFAKQDILNSINGSMFSIKESKHKVNFNPFFDHYELRTYAYSRLHSLSSVGYQYDLSLSAHIKKISTALRRK